ncbi:unnamed protein product [Owenia fusiformis]|uniref:Uncharacterized protein n=1 Tax=Owenia fusiformis TaxID=6347 RepID=A0A8J1UNJ3_OWEFU|nr:unnamed protein product [Owenia fusiformis]
MKHQQKKMRNLSTMKMLCVTIILSVFVYSVIFKYAFIGKNAGLQKEFFFKEIDDEIRDEMSYANEITYAGNMRNADKWIIVTSISYPTQDVKSLANLPEWQLLVVADTKTPPDWHLDGVIFLSVAAQQSLGYKILEHIPYSSYTRKNIGYLYAIQHGAKLIYETDDDNHPTDSLKGFMTAETMYGVVPSSATTVLNPYAYYGQPTTWPRGYPLDNIGDNISGEYNAVHWKTALIQQGAVNGDPDVDAIYRLTRKSNSKLLNLTFDEYMPPLFYPKGTFVPWNSQNTLFLYDAFWGLLLPSSVTSRVTDIWRSYFTQTLLWLIGGHLSYLPPNCYQLRNSHSYIDDAKQEKKFYDQAGELVQFLFSWKCKSNNLPSCIQILADDMALKGFWDISDAKVTAAWLQDLFTIGYEFPKMTSTRLNEPIDFSITLQSDNRFAVSIPSKQLYIGEKKSRIKNLYYKTCYQAHASIVSTQKQLTHQNPILLLIIFNTPRYENIPYLESLYDGHFVKTIYCGPEPPSKAVLHEWEINFITFNATRQRAKMDPPGSFNYECVLKVMKLGMRVKGVLSIADDAIMKVKSIRTLPLDEIWHNSKGFITKEDFLKLVKHTPKFNKNKLVKRNRIYYPIASLKYGSIKSCNSSNLQGKCTLDPFSQFFIRYETNIKDAIDELYQLQSSNEIIKTFLVGLQRKLLGEKRVAKMATDVYYIPQKHFQKFISIAEVFFKHRVFLEIAVPTILHSIGVNDNKLGACAYNWGYGTTRDKPLPIFQAFLDSFLVFLHPVKLSSITKENMNMVELFCAALNSHHFTHPFEQ